MYDNNFECVETEMRRAQNLAYDYQWNGEETAYQKQMKRFIKYRDLLMAGVLRVPKF